MRGEQRNKVVKNEMRRVTYNKDPDLKRFLWSTCGETLVAKSDSCYIIWCFPEKVKMCSWQLLQTPQRYELPLACVLRKKGTVTDAGKLIWIWYWYVSSLFQCIIGWNWRHSICYICFSCSLMRWLEYTNRIILIVWHLTICNLNSSL